MKERFFVCFYFSLGFFIFQEQIFIFVLVLVLVRGGLDTLSKHLNSDGIFLLNTKVATENSITVTRRFSKGSC
ncbi:MAG: hypothetical protein COZ27_02020 [Candidatus Moranbacteria bacterium CG_4_10_14_3_um_filter_41_65]|nr:MAG: hypothetical protein AUK58_02390 [Candidatus Moranbacteria bacterium CG2_30_41_165]PIP25965.1 MAG: hypothetical protein COX32_00550 [Candidatus Moranbacteria bacterium CG23_combo_of_CG06-09_8_20_14_all_41_28]PIV85995.1 MAG: hypothetical protein COW50_03925 [Candidatus Moranbacteria bacterium CG17_big_fil_post_rev_8_21_14_2_50_41_107]PIW94505.1 MAG: hypothetical protein COZ86_00670 [Candidatus Moranbacteria bacterium CG_4_8_14_3_um_filter_41_13]PIX91588.1 MAG: hypothetical protein COZ27_